MPCPYFEPQRPATRAEHPNARLPLIREYDGVCHAGESPIHAPAALRFRFCNHGYSRGTCDQFPAHDLRSALRYHLVRCTESTLDLVCIEEQDYAPLRSLSVQYTFENGQLTPEIKDACMRAQVLAFCHSYRARFSD
ncbi:MAG: hypothetical protein JO097_06200 [Acidobacteriaceae bacterium]|nr:hypothetical protein [Acidobacteriaceae bacterium]MBV9295907.1 hypothetical protein [Acidobacteriaceae bacterium]MBV9765141.1 hypothetical protein [Acidobacteriaceae bacterium]